MADIKFYNDTFVNWFPVKLNLIGNDYQVKNIPIIFNNGMKFFLQECLKDCKDISTNKKTTLFLTDLTKNSFVIENKIKQKEKTPLTTIISPIANIDGKIIISQNIKAETNIWDRLQLTNNKNFTSNENFVFNFYDDYVTINSKQTNKYLTWLTGTDQSDIILYSKIYPLPDNQKFSYMLGPDNIILFKYNNYYDSIVTFSNNFLANILYNTTALGLSSIPRGFDFFPKESILKLLSYEKKDIITSDIKDSFLVKYKTSTISNDEELVVDDIAKNMEYTQNYLGIFPYQNPTIEDDNTANYTLFLHGLKNYQTPEYNYGLYSKNSELEDGKYGVRRIYDRIFTGTNQINGLDQVYLSYFSNTIKIEFEKNTETIFTFAPTSSRKKIQESNLIEDGAIAGETPYVSDRLYFKLKNYSERIIDKPKLPSIVNQYKNIANNSWLCSWLYLDENGNKKWMDRYYNPAYYSYSEALTSKHVKYNDRLYPSKDYTYDVPSTMFLEPGGLYSYFHVGKQTRKNYLNYIDYVNNDDHLPLGSKLLSIQKWDTDPLNDSSNYENNGILYFNNIENLKNSYFVLDGKNHAIFPAKSILLEQTKLTVSIWVKVDDWKNINGVQIFGNYYDSGFGLINESSLTTPIITFISQTTVNNKPVINYNNINYRFGKVGIFPTLFEKTKYSKNYIIQRLVDYSFWVIDIGNKKAKKYSVDDQLIFDVDIVHIDNITQVEIDQNQNLYLFDNITKRYVIYRDIDGKYLNDGVLSSKTNRIEIDINNKIIPIYGNSSVIDNNNSVFQSIAGNIYKYSGVDPDKNVSNSQIFANIGNVQDMTCDSENYLWVAHDQDSISKIDATTNKIVFTFRLGKNSGLPANESYKSLGKYRFLNFIRVPKDKNTQLCEADNIKTEDRLLVIDNIENSLYQLDKSGNLLSKLNLATLTNDANVKIFCTGDFTGYQHIRKYNNANKKLSWKLKIADVNGNNKKLYSLEYNLNEFNAGWHNFSLVFDATEGYVKSYLDSVEIKKYTFEPKKFQLHYNYRTSLLLGIQSIKNTNLNDIIGIDDGYKFIGEVSDLRMYAKALTRGAVGQLYLSNDFTPDSRNMTWNMSCGKRTYIEDIKNWFKLKLPGSKSNYFNINIHNLNVSNETKKLIENSIKNNLNKITPAQTELYKINWI
jgi:hypothetical protein